jgi:hypothetical protein
MAFVYLSGSQPQVATQMRIARGSDVGSREGFVENSIIIGEKSKFVSEFTQNDRENAIIESCVH